MVHTGNQLIAEYQNLLTENESLSTVERATKLVWDVLGGRIRPTDTGLVLESSTSIDADLARQVHRSAKPRGAFDFERWRTLVASQPPTGREHRRLRTLVVDDAIVLTTVPVIASLASFSAKRYSLLMDSCLLVAHHAYFALLPKLEGPNLQQERTFLLSAFQQFADSLTEPADRFTLLALHFDAIDEPQRASESRRVALAATPADAHDFMTVLQSAWSSLVERKKIGDALELLLDNYPRVSRRDLDEMGELIRETFRQGMSAVNGHSAGRGKRATRRKE